MSEELPFFNTRRRPTYNAITPHGNEFCSSKDLSIPSSFRMMDISKDKKFMAIIDNDSLLRVYDIEYTENGIKPIKHRPVARRLFENCNNSLYVFLSVASETGYVAISFAQMNDSGLFIETGVDSNYDHCIVYDENNKSTKIPFQGRAVFTKDSLALVGDWTLEILDQKTLKSKYFLNLSELKQSYEAMIGEKELVKNTPWAEYYPLTRSNTINGKGGEQLIALTRHIKNDILVTTYRGNITKVWSIIDGSLIVSFKTAQGEYTMAISDDNRFIATYNDEDKKVNVYCAKSALLQHTYTLTCMEENQRNTKVNFIRFGNYQRYISFTGTKSGNNGSSNSSNKLFFEVWSITQGKCLVYKEINGDVEGKMPLPFLIETPNDAPNLQDYDFPYFATNFNGVYMTKDTIDESKMTINKFLILDQKPGEMEDGKLWGIYPFRRISKELRIRDKASDIFVPLDNKDKAVTYVIENGVDKFVLRFDSAMVQLWKLEEIKEESVNRNEVFQFELKNNGSNMNRNQRLNRNQNQSQSRSQNQNQNENENENINQTKYYKTYEKSTLIYIRSFKGQHYKPLSTFREDWRLSQKPQDGRYKQQIYFMKDEGRIMVDIKLKDTKQENGLIRDEIFLPLSELDRKTPTSDPDKPDLRRSSSTSMLSTRSSIYYHEIESFSQALHSLYVLLKRSSEGQQSHTSGSDEVMKNGTAIFKKTKSLLEDLVFSGGAKRDFNTVSGRAKRYFNTVSGSKTLAMLASFPTGQDIITRIIQYTSGPPFPMKIFSYAVRENESENVLTVLMDESRYDLFQLLFNQILLDYYEEGIGNLSALIDVLLYLQKEKSSARLLTCIQRLSYLPVRFSKSALLESEYYKMHSDTPAEEDEASSLEYLKNFSALEQINKYKPGCFSYCPYQFKKICQKINRKLFKASDEAAPVANGNGKSKYSKKAQVCIVPLPYFNSYRIYPEISLMEDFTRYHRNSLFTRTALSDSENQIFKQGYTVMEVLVSYKWNAFAKFRFRLILFLQIAYYISYTVGVSFAEELFDYIPGTPITHLGQIAALFISLFLGLLFFFQETRQFRVVQGSYFNSIYNYVDLASFTFPLITFILLRTNSDGLDEFSSVSTLILWIHFILRLRVYRFVGYLLEMVIQLTVKILPVTVVMIVIVIAFTHSFFVLLRKRDDLFSEALGDEDENGGTDVNNIFASPFFAFITVWFFIFGVFDPIFDGELGSYPMALILAVLFSIIIVLVLFNVVIALMSGTVEDISTTGTKCWIGHYASVVAEIELLWCFPSERLSKNNSPIYLYYNANRETVEAHHQSIVKETNKLKKKLGEKIKEKSSRKNDSNEFNDEE